MYNVVIKDIKKVDGKEYIHSYIWNTYRTKFAANIWARDINDGLKELGRGFAYVERGNEVKNK